MAGVCRRWRDVVMGESNEAHLWRTLYARDFEPFIPSAPSRTFLPPRSARAGDCASAGRAAVERERYADAAAVDALVCPTWVQLHAHNSGRTVGRLLPSLAPQEVHAAAPLASRRAFWCSVARRGAARVRAWTEEWGPRACTAGKGARAACFEGRTWSFTVAGPMGGRSALPPILHPSHLSLLHIAPPSLCCVHKYISPLLLHFPRPFSQKLH